MLVNYKLATVVMFDLIHVIEYVVVIIYIFVYDFVVYELIFIHAARLCQLRKFLPLK